MRRLLALLLLCVVSSSAQYTLEVRFAADHSRKTHIGTFQREGILYGSLNDLASIFNLNVFINSTAQKIELKTSKHVVKATANNPFVIVTDRNNTASIIQLPVNTLFAANSFFAPLESFIPILDALLEEEIVFNRKLQLIAVGMAPVKPRFDVHRMTVEQRANGELVRIHLNKQIRDYESWLKPIDPPRGVSGQDRAAAAQDYWLYVTLADAVADTAAINATKPSGLIKKVLAFQSPTSVQLTFRLRGQISGTEILQDERGTDLLLTIHTPTAEEIARKRARENERNLERERDRWKLDVIVIDPGHGGKDPGTIGVTGVKEKDITLALALKLGKLIEKNLPGVKVVYTRKTDEFIELYRRGQIANQAGGKLFISIHCNSMPRKPHPMNGFEIYLLRPGKTEHALRIAERENAVVKFEEGYEERYQELTEENFILLTMAQTAYMRYSEQFADILQREMESHGGLQNQGVKQAGFYVLIGASMPNILFETGYLSNRTDERFLKSQRGQQKIAQAIFNAVKRYKLEYEKALQEGKMMGTSQ